VVPSKGKTILERDSAKKKIYLLGWGAAEGKIHLLGRGTWEVKIHLLGRGVGEGQRHSIIVRERHWGEKRQSNSKSVPQNSVGTFTVSFFTPISTPYG
jgi:hypothetical protein